MLVGKKLIIVLIALFLSVITKPVFPFKYKFLRNNLNLNLRVMDVEHTESVVFSRGQGESSRTPNFTLNLQFMCLGWEDAYKISVAWSSVLLSLYRKPHIGEELLYTCVYMKDPTRSSKENSKIVQLENLVWSLWGHSSSNAWKLLGFFAAWRNRTWDRTTFKMSGYPGEFITDISLCI